MSTPASRVDVRAIAPRDRHPLIFSTFSALAPGQCMELVNDHDPRPLFHQFDAQRRGQFDWAYLEQGPDLWRVAITRTAGTPAPQAQASTGCCGQCGCA